ncbi:MAG: DUF3343 domain-containing protein [Thermodesulfobacteriota bacterium]
MEYILAFGSPHRALRAEGVLKGAGISFRLLPAPKALAEFCDLVISVKEGSLDKAKDALKDAGVTVTMVFKKEEEKYVEV